MKMSKFKEIINGDQPVLVDFYATWCGPCKTQAPILDEFKKKAGSKITVLKVDVDKNQAAAQQFNIRSIPTLLLFKKGKIVWRKSGVAPIGELLGLLNN